MPPHPDECFYSVAARTRVAVAEPSARIFAEQLCGSPRLHLDYGVGFQKAQSGFLKDADIFLKTTVSGFISSFLLPTKRSKFCEAVRNGDHTTASYVLGRMGARRRNLPFYRYCSRCYCEQINRQGEACWTRLPQVNGFTHCPVHRIPYTDSTAKRDFPKDFICLDEKCLGLQNEVRPDPKYQEALFDLSVAGQNLLDRRPIFTAAIDEAWERLLAASRHVSKGRVKDLAGRIIDRYGEEYLAHAGCRIGPVLDHSWVADFLRKPSDEPDPVRHLLVLRTLGHSLDDLEENTKASLFGPIIDDSMICLNPVCQHYQSHGLRQMRVFVGTNRKRLAHITCMNCFSIVERCLESKSDRIFDRGSLWEESLATLWVDQTLSVRQIAKKLGTESLTVKRHALRLQLPFPRAGPRMAQIVPRAPLPKGVSPSQRADRRTSWLAAMNQHKSVSKARQVAQKDYAWLYRHDRGWLKENSPVQPQVSEKRLSKIDWIGREREFMSRVESAYYGIMARSPTQQCTVTAMLQEIRAAKYLKSLENMPMLKARLIELAENRVAYALRRIALAKETLGENRTRTNLIEAAGLRDDLLLIPIIQESLD